MEGFMKRLSIVLLAGVVLLTSVFIECADSYRNRPYGALTSKEREQRQTKIKQQQKTMPTKVGGTRFTNNNSNSNSGANWQARLRNFGRSFSNRYQQI